MIAMMTSLSETLRSSSTFLKRAQIIHITITHHNLFHSSESPQTRKADSRSASKTRPRIIAEQSRHCQLWLDTLLKSPIEDHLLHVLVTPHFVRGTNRICYLDKYILHVGQICKFEMFVSWTNTLFWSHPIEDHLLRQPLAFFKAGQTFEIWGGHFSQKFNMLKHVYS